MKTVGHPSSSSRRRISGERAASRPVKLRLDRGRGGVPARKHWSDRALMSLPRNGCKYELLNGQIIMSPAGFNHGDLCARLITELNLFVRDRKLGKVCDGQTGFRLRCGVKQKTTLSPDVSFVSQGRISAATAPLEKFFEGAPDLAMEVLSPDDRLSKVQRKIRLYFQNGCRLAWVFDPLKRQAQVHGPAGEVLLKSIDDLLDGGEVLPGFTLEVRRILA